MIKNEYHHVMTKSIAGFIVFNNENEFARMIDLLSFYQIEKPLLSFSQFAKLSLLDRNNFLTKQKSNQEDKLVDIISFCVMPTHLHLSLKQLLDGGISLYMKNILNSYAKYFNLKHIRKGPLWESRFKNVLIKDDSQLLHLTRYHHLNPVSAGLAERPEDWIASSYKEYLNLVDLTKRICNFENVLNMKPTLYKKFVDNRISYQKQLSRIKKILLE